MNKDEIVTKNGKVIINPPQGATMTETLLAQTLDGNIYRLEWSHGLICILTESISKDEINPVFNYSVYDLGNGDYEIDYNHKNPYFVDRKS